MTVLSLREHPALVERFVGAFSKWWATETTRPLYRDCIEHTPQAASCLPQWYLLEAPSGEIVGGAGLIPNDFISRMDLTPWLCALYIEAPYRKLGHGGRLIAHLAEEARRLGFEKLYLCTDLEGYYERYQFSYLGSGFHPWGDESRIYERSL